MLDRHAVHALLKAGESKKDIAKQFGVSRRTIERIAKEPPVKDGDDAAERRRREIGRRPVAEAVKRSSCARQWTDPLVRQARLRSS